MQCAASISDGTCSLRFGLAGGEERDGAFHPVCTLTIILTMTLTNTSSMFDSTCGLGLGLPFGLNR